MASQSPSSVLDALSLQTKQHGDEEVRSEGHDRCAGAKRAASHFNRPHDRRDLPPPLDCKS